MQAAAAVAVTLKSLHTVQHVNALAAGESLTFDKVGVTADYIQIGEYKGADEEYTRTAPSDELRGQLQTARTDARLDGR